MKASDHRFVIYASGHRKPDVYSRSYVPVFYTAHEARTWLMQFLNGKEHRFEGDDILLETDFAIRLRSSQWRDIMAAPIANEKMSSEHAQWILRFKYGTWDEVHDKPALLEDSDGGLVVARAPRAEHERRPDVPPSFVTITQLCSTCDVLPRIARAVLRGSGRVKPAYGWAFAPNEVANIKKLIGVG